MMVSIFAVFDVVVVLFMTMSVMLALRCILVLCNVSRMH